MLAPLNQVIPMPLCQRYNQSWADSWALKSIVIWLDLNCKMHSNFRSSSRMVSPLRVAFGSIWLACRQIIWNNSTKRLNMLHILYVTHYLASLNQSASQPVSIRYAENAYRMRYRIFLSQPNERSNAQKMIKIYSCVKEWETLRQ